MEPNKIEKIRSNLHQLVKHTICKAPFLEFFVEKKVFGVSDIDAIRAKRGETEQASEFYNIIQTRVDSYPVLIQALHAMDQSDIATILEEGVIPSRLDVRSRVRKLLYEETEGAVRPRSNVTFNFSDPVELFTGRREEIIKLHQWVQRSSGTGQPTVISQMTSISGLGGIGKTQLARQYIKEHGKDFDGNCIWLHAENEESLIKSFRTLAKDKLKITTKDADGTDKQIATVVEEVYTYFEMSKSLFIFDNAEKTPWLRKFLPKSSKSIIGIILTSRDREWDKGIPVIDVNELLEEDAVAMVKRGLGIEEDDSRNQIILKLVRRLQCFPLALQQAISYIEVQQEMDDYSVEFYLEDFEKHKQELLSFGGEDELNFELHNDYVMTTFTTWKMTIERISLDKANGEMALRILYVMAYLSPELIERDVFFGLPNIDVGDYVSASNSNDALSGSGVVSEDRVKAGIRLLVKFSMIRAEDKQRILSIHRLVQDVMRMDLSRQHKWANALKEAFQIVVQKSENGFYMEADYVAIIAHATKTLNTNDKLGKAVGYTVKLIEYLIQGNEDESLLFGLAKFHKQHFDDFFAHNLPELLQDIDTRDCSPLAKCITAVLRENGVKILRDYIQLWEIMATNDPDQLFSRKRWTGISDLVGFLNLPLPLTTKGGTAEVSQSGHSLLTNTLGNVLTDGPFNCLYKLFMVHYESVKFQESVELFWNTFPNLESFSDGDSIDAFKTHLFNVLNDLISNPETADLVAEVLSDLDSD